MTAGLGSGITGVAVIIWLLANVLCYAANENSWLSRLLHFPPLLCISNGLRFADAQPETFWLFDILDPRDLARSFWIGSRGLLLLRLLILIYLAEVLTTVGLTANGFETAQWMAYFTSWSFCLVAVSTALGIAVSLKYLITCHHISRVIVHGRPGLTPRHRELQYADGCLASTSAAATDLECGITPQTAHPIAPTSVLTTHSCHGDNSWVMQAPVSTDSASISRGGSSPSVNGNVVKSQLQAGTGSAPISQSAFVSSSHRAKTPSDLESLAPAELRYAPQLIHWSMLEKVHCLALQTAAVTSTLVLVFYWAVVAGSGITGPYPDDYLRHAANAPIMLLDVWFSKVPFASYHLQVMILYGSVYELFMWVYYGASDHWVYNALNWHTDKSVAVYILLPVGYVALFSVWFAVASIRNYLGFHGGSHLLCPRCYERHSHHAATQFQKQQTPTAATGRLKKQSSNIVTASPGRDRAIIGNLDIIAADTRYSGQQVLTGSGRQISTQSPENPSFMELSRRGSAPRQG